MDRLVRDHDRILAEFVIGGRSTWIPCQYCKPLPMSSYLDKRNILKSERNAECSNADVLTMSLSHGSSNGMAMTKNSANEK
eukprot:scaffold949_cov186-Alexandrium_tamarense.AAC.3